MQYPLLAVDLLERSVAVDDAANSKVLAFRVLLYHRLKNYAQSLVALAALEVHTPNHPIVRQLRDLLVEEVRLSESGTVP